MAKKLLGRATITRDGATLLSATGAKLSLSGFTREPVVGDTVHGYTETAVPAYVEVTVSVSDDVDLEALASDVGVDVLFQGDAGGSWVLPAAVQQNQVTATAQSGGQVSLKYFSDQSQKVTS